MKLANTEFLELSKDILAKGHTLRFQAKGWSMFPSLKNADILNVFPVSLDQIKKGDIILFRSQDARIVAHRVIKKILSKEGISLRAKGDFYRGQEEIVPLGNILGKVGYVERNGRKINIAEGKGKLKDSLSCLFAPLIKIARGSASWLLHYIQGLQAYSSLAMRLLKINVVYSSEFLGENVECILAKCNDTAIGEATITQLTEDDDYKGWWIFDMWVHWKYRRLGIARKVTEMASLAAAQKQASEIRLFVFEDNLAAVNLYKKSGFCRIIVPRIEQELEEEARQSGRRRILMRKTLAR